MRTINKGLGSNTFRQYGMGESGRTAIEVLQSLYSEVTETTLNALPPAGYAFLTDKRGNRLTTHGEYWIVRI